MKDWLLSYFSIGYGPEEFHRDRHVAWTIFLAYTVTRLPEVELGTYTFSDFHRDLLTVCVMVAVALAKSWLGKTNPPQPS